MPTATRNSSRKRRLAENEHPETKPSMNKRRKINQLKVADQQSPNTEIERPSDLSNSSDQSHEQSNSPNSPQKPQTLRIDELTGSLFSAPSNALIVHACNTRGRWGAGIARAFQNQYPKAFKIYEQHCKIQTDSSRLLGTALLIDPVDYDPTPGRDDADRDETIALNSTNRKTHAREPNEDKKRPHFIGCLFTSINFGKRRSSTTEILEATVSAMRDLLSQVTAWNESCVSKNDESEKKRERIGDIWTCRINSGLFHVPWRETRAVLLEIEVSDYEDKCVTVVSLEKEG